jgi:hypothetical protein
LEELMTVHSKKQPFANAPTQSLLQQELPLHLALVHHKKHPSPQNLPLQVQSMILHF